MRLKNRIKMGGSFGSTIFLYRDALFEQLASVENTQSANADSVVESKRTSLVAGDVRWIRISVFTIFFLSGVAALIYEISWTRQIGLLFGHTVHAASIVLASYFAGMSFGYWAGAKWSTRISPLLGYAIAEFVVVAWTFAIPVILEASQSSTIAPLLSNSSIAWQTTTRALFSFLLLLPATISLGVTLPMIAHFFANQAEQTASESSSRAITSAYALNTAGAFTGVLIATFYLLVVVGVRSSSYVAAALSATCAVLAFAISRFVNVKSSSSDERNLPFEPAIDRPTGIGNFTLAALSGFAMLALQVLYTRMFSLVFHNSTYTFGIVVLVFLASLGIGSSVTAQLQHRISPRRIAGVTTALGALAATLSVPVFIWLTELKYFSFGDSFLQYMTGAILLVTVVVAPSISCLGMLLPLVWTMSGGSKTNGQVVGRLTAVNTIAAAIGAVVASFFLLVWIGLWASFVLISALLMVAALILLWQAQQKKLCGMAVFLFGVVAALTLVSPTESAHNQTEYDEHLIQRWNSSYGWIDVIERKKSGAFKIRQNLHYRFGTTGSNVREYRQAHIPILLHENPIDVLFMGLGTGLTAGGAIPHQKVKSIVAVELIPEVVEAARVLAEHNYNVVDHPKVEIHIDDARHELLANHRKYDVIVSDLFVPWESETGYLYTVEHYQVAASRLKTDGLFCQWLPLYQLGEREFELIANSFASAFPHTTIWWGQLETTSPVIALIGGQSPIGVDPSVLANRLDQLKRNLKSPDKSIATPERFWEHYIADWPRQVNSILNTDEHPRVEFLTPVSNRDQKMIKGKVLKKYFNDTVFQLPTNSAKLKGESSQDSVRRRETQRLILFGR